jgi:hypothetical protein
MVPCSLNNCELLVYPIGILAPFVYNLAVGVADISNGFKYFIYISGVF